MKLDVIKLDGGKAGNIELDADLFGLEPRADILHRVVRWQRNNAQAGTHKVKTRSEVNYSTKKIYRQKGTGGARHGARSAPIFRGGGVYKGPVVRSHGHDLPKKFRKLGLRHALSAKMAAGEFNRGGAQAEGGALRRDTEDHAGQKAEEGGGGALSDPFNEGQDVHWTCPFCKSRWLNDTGIRSRTLIHVRSYTKIRMCNSLAPARDSA